MSTGFIVLGICGEMSNSFLGSSERRTHLHHELNPDYKLHGFIILGIYSHCLFH